MRLREKVVLTNIFSIILASLFGSFIVGYLDWFLPLHVMKTGGAVALAQIFSVIAIISFVLSVPFAYFSDIVGRKPLIVLSSVIRTLGILLIFISPYFLPILLTGILIYSIAPTIASGAANAILPESILDKRILGRVISLFPIVPLVGMSLGSVFLGHLTSTSGIFLPLLIISMLSLLRVSVLLALKETLSSKSRNLPDVREVFIAKTKELRATLSRPELRAFICMEIVGGLSFFSAFMPSYFSSVMRLNETVIGLAFSIFMIAQAIGQPISGFFVDRYGCKLSFLLNSMVGAIILASLTFIGPIYPIQAIFLLFISSSLSAFYNTAYSVYIAKVTTEEIRATVYSAMSAIKVIPSAIAPFIGALVWNLSPLLIPLSLSALCLLEIPFIMML
ncbi:MAG: MFS transporter, partial [Candidatus Methanodesulfokora sp.]